MLTPNFATDDALDQVFGTGEPAASDAVDTTAAPQEDLFADPLETNQATVDDTNPSDDVNNQEQTPPAGEESKPDTTEGTAPEGTNSEGANAEPNAADNGEDPEVALQRLLDEIEVKDKEAQTAEEQIQKTVEDSSMSDQEKNDLLSKLGERDSIIKEKDDMIAELQVRYKTLEDKHVGAITENEGYRIDSLTNKKFIDKIQNDPTVHEFVTLKINADNGDADSAQKLEQFLSDQMKSLGYDVGALVEANKKAEKMGMSKQSSPSYSSGDLNLDGGDQGDAIDMLSA